MVNPCLMLRQHFELLPERVAW